MLHKAKTSVPPLKVWKLYHMSSICYYIILFVLGGGRVKQVSLKVKKHQVKGAGQ